MSTSRHTIGTDPEFFVVDKETGELKSAIPLIDGTKYEPKKMPGGSMIQRDNVALEFATPPAVNGQDFVSKIREAFQDVMKELPAGYDIAPIPSANFSPEQLDHVEAQMFGCDPDFDVWTMTQNTAPYAPDHTFRSCGAHIHVGYTEGSGNEFLLEFGGKFATVKTMDLVHGIISTVLDSSPEAIARKKLYGKAGCHRITSYGIEYRVLSNFWLKSPQLVMLMDSLTVDVLNLVRTNKHEEMIEAIGQDTIVSTINEGNVLVAKEIIDSYLMEVLSETSKDLLAMCIEKINTFDFKKEWEMEA